MPAVEQFFAMGGYGAYVWGAYGLAALVMAGLYAVSRTDLRRSQRRLRALEGERGGSGRRRRGEAAP